MFLAMSNLSIAILSRGATVNADRAKRMERKGRRRKGETEKNERERIKLRGEKRRKESPVGGDGEKPNGIFA